MFRFTIRDVLWLMVVVGMCVAWWMDHKRQKGIADFAVRGEIQAEQRIQQMWGAMDQDQRGAINEKIELWDEAFKRSIPNP